MLNEMETHVDTTEREERMMDVRTLFVADTQASMFVKPPDGAFDVPSQYPESAAVFGVRPCDEPTHPALEKFGSMRVGIVGSVRDDDIRLAARSAAFAAHRRDGFDEGNQLGDVMLVGADDDDGKRNALPVGDEVVLGARFASIRDSGRFEPPKKRRARSRSPHLRGTNRYGLHRATSPTRPRGFVATRQETATEPDAANTSFRSHSPFLWAAVPTECRFEAQRECPSTPCDWEREVAREYGAPGPEAEAVR
jgi:hypothetical protein